MGVNQWWEILQWGVRFIKYHILPLSGGQDDQPHLFWVILDILNKKITEEKKGEKKHMKYNIELKW